VISVGSRDYETYQERQESASAVDTGRNSYFIVVDNGGIMVDWLRLVRGDDDGVRRFLNAGLSLRDWLP
jgi:hypothetical protein